ncbi:MAG: hypothetical protein ACXVCY_04120 [Pseudobdellovibrionaceae bacterium]
MDFFPSPNLVSSTADLLTSVVGDFLSKLIGSGPYENLYDQSESNMIQYDPTPADRSQWHMKRKDQSSRDYAFLLKWGDKIVEIPFNINPQRESISEPHALATTHTQGGGKLNNSDGMISKEITISGTCGLYPGERRGRLPDSGIGSGFEAFKMLQNTFRKYCYLKRFGDATKSLELIYVNRRRQESWVVEPRTFSSEDAIEHNNTFTYNITLETLYPYTGAETKSLVEKFLDGVPFYRSIDRLAQRLVEAVDQVNAVAGQISSIVDGFYARILSRVVGLSNSVADVAAGRLPNVVHFKRDSVKGLVGDLRDTSKALEAAGAHDLAHEVVKLERQVTQILLQDQLFEANQHTKGKKISEIKKAGSDSYVGLDGTAVSPSDAKDAGAVSTRPSSGAVMGGNSTTPNALPGTATALMQQRNYLGPSTQTVATIGGSSLDLNGKMQASRFTNEPDTQFALPPSTDSIEGQRMWDQAWSGYLSNLNPAVSDIRAARVNYNDSIQTVAFRLLGDHARWPELVILNDLKYPYVADKETITSQGLNNVIAWGEIILYPVPKTSVDSGVRTFRNETFESLALSPQERALGCDVYINPNTGDIDWTNNDIKVAYGIDNISQFIRKRVTLKKYSLRRSLRLGFSNVIGLSNGINEAITKAEAQSLFFGDNRISSAQVVGVKKVGQTYQLQILVKVKDLQDPLLLLEKI